MRNLEYLLPEPDQVTMKPLWGTVLTDSRVLLDGDVAALPASTPTLVRLIPGARVALDRYGKGLRIIGMLGGLPEPDINIPWANKSIIGPYNPGTIDDTILVSRSGRNVFLEFQASANSAAAQDAITISTQNSNNLVCKIPSEHLPTGRTPVWVIQGSGSNIANVRLESNGDLHINRYGPGNVSSHVWLPVTVSWMASD